MKRLIILAVAASLAGCHSRADETAGAAPDRGDSTATTRTVDPNRTGPPGEQGRPSGSEINVDSVTADTGAMRVHVDTASADSLKAQRSIPQDTLGPGTPDSVPADTTSR
jgi:hypothetical protein